MRKKIVILMIVIITMIVAVIIGYNNYEFSKYYKENTVYDYEENWDKYEEIIVRAIYWSAFWDNKWLKETMKKLERKKEIPVYVYISRKSKKAVKVDRYDIPPILDGRNTLDVYIDELKSVITLIKAEGQIVPLMKISTEGEIEMPKYYKEEVCPPCKIMKIRLKKDYKKVMDEKEECKNSIMMKELIKDIIEGKYKKNIKSLCKFMKEKKGYKETILEIGYFNSKYPLIYYKIEGLNNIIGEAIFNVKTKKMIYNWFRPLWYESAVVKEKYRIQIKKLDKYSFKVKIEVKEEKEK